MSKTCTFDVVFEVECEENESGKFIFAKDCPIESRLKIMNGAVKMFGKSEVLYRDALTDGLIKLLENLKFSVSKDLDNYNTNIKGKTIEEIGWNNAGINLTPNMPWLSLLSGFDAESGKIYIEVQSRLGGGNPENSKFSQYESATLKTLEGIYTYLGEIFPGYKGSTYIVCPILDIFGIDNIGTKRESTIFDHNVVYSETKFPYSEYTFPEYASWNYQLNMPMI